MNRFLALFTTDNLKRIALFFVRSIVDVAVQDILNETYGEFIQDVNENVKDETEKTIMKNGVDMYQRRLSLNIRERL